jgi:hypothetical protein
MTLETAKEIIKNENRLPNKEAEAVVRGGMNICEQVEDGRRKYVWIKVKPTKTDNESSIALALAKYRLAKDSQNKLKAPKAEHEVAPVPPTPQKTPIQVTHPIKRPQSMRQRIKKKLWELWKEIDEVVIE